MVAAPRQRYMAPSTMNDIPIAVISGARRGALRSGRYATRSMVTLIPPMISITAGKTSSSAITLVSVSESPLTAKKPSSAEPMNALSVKMSPCAKLISSMMPYTIV